MTASPLVAGGTQRDSPVYSIGDAPPRLRAAGTRPASGIRVLDLTRVIAGPVATRYLAALGADVLRLDPPHHPEMPLQARDGLLGKRCALLDFGTPDGSARLHELLSSADVTTVGSAEGPVTVVKPPGRLDGAELAWPSPLTRYGGDPAAWR